MMISFKNQNQLIKESRFSKLIDQRKLFIIKHLRILILNWVIYWIFLEMKQPLLTKLKKLK